jgi:phosphatidylglycerol phospholipase C
MGPRGAKFIRDVQKARRPLFVWTVNDVDMMEWSISKDVDGVITDNPKKFRKVLEDYDETKHVTVSLLRWIDVIRVNLFVLMVDVLFRWKYGSREDRGRIRLQVTG